jgi:hypothetical protein
VVILLIVLPHTDLKIIQKSVLIKWNGSFGLDVFDWWLEFVEGFCGHGNLWMASVDMVISLEVLEQGISCKVSWLTSFHSGNEVTSFKA